jgi:pilus assembly protein TadC
MASVFDNRNTFVLSIVTVVFMGVAFPSVLLYLNIFYGLDIWFVGFFCLISIGAAFGIPAVLAEKVVEAKTIEKDDKDVERLRESIIELLRDLDEITKHLKDIDTILKGEE